MFRSNHSFHPIQKDVAKALAAKKREKVVAAEKRKKEKVNAAAKKKKMKKKPVVAKVKRVDIVDIVEERNKKREAGGKTRVIRNNKNK